MFFSQKTVAVQFSLAKYQWLSELTFVLSKEEVIHDPDQTLLDFAQSGIEPHKLTP